MSYHTPCRCCETKLSSTSVVVNGSGTAVNVNVIVDTVLKKETKYCLILCQPCPVAGYNLPVNIVVSSATDEPTITVPLKKLYNSYDCGFCNIEFAEELPKCRNRLPLYFTNGNDFIDIRGHEHMRRCR